MLIFKNYVKDLEKTREKLILCGDYNICHRPIDIHDPVRNATNSGFLPEEREWIGNFIDSGFIDTFRLFHRKNLIVTPGGAIDSMPEQTTKDGVSIIAWHPEIYKPN